MANGDVLVAAGLGTDSSALSIALSSAEIYDPRANRWSMVAGMGQLHAGHTATLLGNGMVLVVGTLGHSRSELYDPTRNAWTSTGPAMDRYHHTATRLSDGRVLIVGGYGIESFHSVLLYDPKAVAPVQRKPIDPRLIAAVFLAALLLLAGFAISIPGVRRRLRRWRPRDQPEEWVT
jgi:N-acetylneuraminic acid mutarotase